MARTGRDWTPKNVHYPEREQTFFVGAGWHPLEVFSISTGRTFTRGVPRVVVGFRTPDGKNKVWTFFTKSHSHRLMDIFEIAGHGRPSWEEIKKMNAPAIREKLVGLHLYGEVLSKHLAAGDYFVRRVSTNAED